MIARAPAPPNARFSTGIGGEDTGWVDGDLMDYHNT